MNSKLTKDMTVGSIVAEDFNRAQTLEQMGIDYCCHGSDTLQTACEKKRLPPKVLPTSPTGLWTCFSTMC